MKLRYSIGPLLATILFVWGCSGQKPPPDLPKLYPIVLEFTQKKQPLADASVTIIPTGADTRWFSGGNTDSQGRLAPKTHGKYPGLAEGEYRILVSKTEADPASIKRTSKNEEETQYYDYYHLADPKYSGISSTPLTIKVQGKESFTFELGAPVRVKIVPKDI